MNARENLIDTCKRFEIGIRDTTSELIYGKVKADESKEITKKLQDYSLFSSKRKLLQASAVALTPEIAEQAKNSNSLSEYGAVALDKVLEQSIVKYVMHCDAIKKLVQTPNAHLNGDRIEKKKKVIRAITDYMVKENLLVNVDKVLKEKEQELITIQNEWYEKVRNMREKREETSRDELDVDEPDEFDKARFVSNINILRSVIQRLIVGRSKSYDWLSDPHGLLAILKDARNSDI